MNNRRKRPQTQSGFSLVEMLMVVLLLSIVVGALFTQIQRAQVRHSVEERRLDLTQEQRDFIDQFTRDLHQSGFPSVIQFGGRFDLSSNQTAAGIWMISPTDIRMEADVDGDGIVDEIAYHYDGGGTPCPCLRRSSSPKQAGVLPWNQPAPVYYTQVEGIIQGDQPIFQAYDTNGNVQPIAGGVQLASATPNDPTYQFLKNIKNVRITFSTQAKGTDTDAHRTIQVTMTGMARLPNN